MMPASSSIQTSSRYASSSIVLHQPFEDQVQPQFRIASTYISSDVVAILPDFYPT